MKAKPLLTNYDIRISKLKKTWQDWVVVVGGGGWGGEGKCKKGYSEEIRCFRALCQKFWFGFPKNNSAKSNFPGFLVQWFAFRKRNKFPFLRQLSKEISVPFASVSKGVELLVELMNTPKSKWGDHCLLKRPSICWRPVNCPRMQAS